LMLKRPITINYRVSITTRPTDDPAVMKSSIPATRTVDWCCFG
jgi:hypothetical protein